jgi:Xaa-Pro dipeptidase
VTNIRQENQPVDLARIQSVLAQCGFDARLFYDHHHRDPIAYRVLGLPEEMPVSRRWFYVIPAQGTPKKLVHRVEPEHLDSLPGAKQTYSAWRELADQLKAMLAPFPRVAMQYSPNNLIFYVGIVDAGTVEMVREFGHEIVNSGDLVAYFEAALSDEQIQAHFRARDKIDAITAEAFREIGRRVRDGGTTEYNIQQWIMQAFVREGLTTAGDKPVVAVNENSSIPHYAPTAEHSAAIGNGDFASRCLGEGEYAGRCVLRHHLDRMCRPTVRTAAGNLRDSEDARDLGVATVNWLGS